MMEIWPHFLNSKLEPKARPEPKRWRIPRSVDYFATQTTFVDSADASATMADLASEIRLSHVGWDFEFSFDAPTIHLSEDKAHYDCRSIRPLLLSLAFAEQPDPDGNGQICTYVVDVRRPEVLLGVQSVLRLPITFVGHYLNAEFKCLFALDLSGPARVWDTWACSRALNLGLYHRKNTLSVDPGEAAQVREDAKQSEEKLHALITVGEKYGLHHPHATDKERLQKSFIEQPLVAAFSQEQIDYSAADAILAARIYPHQLSAAAAVGSIDHVLTVEMPWVEVNARMEWKGIRIDANRCRDVLAACDRHLEAQEPLLAAHAIWNVRSPSDLEAFFQRAGLLDLFWKRGGYCFDKEQLELFEACHPVIPIIRSAKKALQLRSDPLLSGALVGVDGRVHPEHHQLGTDTGRQTCNRPNVLGLGRVLRPLVIPDFGYGIGEVDLCQIEVGIAAGVYSDEKLAEMFNTGDVYSAMAQRFFAAELSAEDLAITGNEFKQRHPSMRDRMKRCTLGIVYGMSPYGLSNYLGIHRGEAAKLLEQFLGMFPVLRRALDDAAFAGGRRGYASTSTGLCRHRGGRGKLSTWEKNWLTNHPVQGTAAALFKRAGIRLDRLYRQWDARLIIPLHDAYVFEAPLTSLVTVAELTRRVMCETVQEEFPNLRPCAEINISRPDCWNKDGEADSLTHWVNDPMYRLE